MATTADGVSIDRICPACGATNNIPAGQISTSSRCHACQAAWRLAEPISVDEASFAAITRKARLPIVTVFCDARSAPCRRIAPDLHELARETSGQAIFLKVDTEQHPQIGYDFGVRSLPHLLICGTARWCPSEPTPSAKRQCGDGCAPISIHPAPSLVPITVCQANE